MKAPPKDKSRRDFLLVATASMGAVGIGLAVWPLIDSMNPAADMLALSPIDVDLEPIEAGQRITVAWRGRPVFIGHRTAEEIAKAKADAAAELIDPEPDSARVNRQQWLIVVGVCTHLGCVPLGQNTNHPRGKWGGWFCRCHGSHYDTSGRIRKGPAPRNLDVPAYRFIDDSTVRIG